MSTYRQLDADAITQTLEKTCARITERFPQSNLRRIAEQMLLVAQDTTETVRYLSQPNWPLRIGGAIAVLVLFALLLIVGAFTMDTPAEMTLSEVLQTIEAGINDIVFFGVAVFFFMTVETRVKRRRALSVLHQLRSLSHIVDMHQLTKDPERLMKPGGTFTPGASGPATGKDLAKYLDLCSELLSIISKLAALLVQRFDDSVVLSGVNEIEALTTGLSSKIWQKITILERAAGDHE